MFSCLHNEFEQRRKIALYTIKHAQHLDMISIDASFMVQYQPTDNGEDGPQGKQVERDRKLEPQARHSLVCKVGKLKSWNPSHQQYLRYAC